MIYLIIIIINMIQLGNRIIIVNIKINILENIFVFIYFVFLNKYYISLILCYNIIDYIN